MRRRTERIDVEGWAAQLRKGSLELAILGALWDRKRYGIEIIRIVKERCDVNVSEGTIYPILSRLKAEDYLVAEWFDAETGHPRKYHWLTKKGRARARALAETWARFTRGLDVLVQPMLQAGAESGTAG